MNERLQKALQLLLRGQDSDSVNSFFTRAICDHGQSAIVDLLVGKVTIINDETGDEVGCVRFVVSIDEITPG